MRKMMSMNQLDQTEDMCEDEVSELNSLNSFWIDDFDNDFNSYKLENLTQKVRK